MPGPDQIAERGHLQGHIVSGGKLLGGQGGIIYETNIAQSEIGQSPMATAHRIGRIRPVDAMGLI